MTLRSAVFRNTSMRQMQRWRWLIGFVLALSLALTATPSRSESGWQMPPPPIDQLIDAPLPPADLDTYNSLRFRRLPAGPWQTITLPNSPQLAYLQWSPDSQAIAFALVQDTGLELWVANLSAGTARRLTPPQLNATYGHPCDWQRDSRSLLCKIVPADRPPPPEPTLPSGPRIEENLGRAAPARTYTNLLQNQHDIANFEHYFTSALEEIHLDGSRRRLVEPTLIDAVTPSPDGRYLLLATLHRPFSYQVPAWRFPQRSVVLDSATGTEVYPVANLPLADSIPIAIGSTRPGRRDIAWRSDQPATLYWNAGTDPLQSERFYKALKGLGATVRWVELPFEGHGCEAWEGVAHVLWEIIRWSDRCTQSPAATTVEP